MYTTEKEIFAQYDALKKTYECVVEKKEELKAFFEKGAFQNMVFIGCGSGYCLCNSAYLQAALRTGVASYSVAAGDLLVNFEHYKAILKNALLVAPSRSGSTSEVVMAVERAKADCGVKVLSVSAKKDSDLSRIADFAIDLPWAFDESVCQTRTVSNLYIADLLVIAAFAGDNALIEETEKALKLAERFLEANKEALKKIGSLSSWNNAVVLADSEVQGIAAEGAVAFKEIPQLHSNYYHILDVRHGPMVVVKPDTLVVIALTDGNADLQKALIADVKKKGATVVAVGNGKDCGADYVFDTPVFQCYALQGIFLINVIQCIALAKALERGINPDLPDGLEAWIKL